MTAIESREKKKNQRGKEEAEAKTNIDNKRDNERK